MHENCYITSTSRTLKPKIKKPMTACKTQYRARAYARNYGRPRNSPRRREREKKRNETDKKRTRDNCATIAQITRIPRKRARLLVIPTCHWVTRDRARLFLNGARGFLLASKKQKRNGRDDGACSIFRTGMWDECCVCGAYGGTILSFIEALLYIYHLCD